MKWRRERPDGPAPVLVTAHDLDRLYSNYYAHHGTTPAVIQLTPGTFSIEQLAVIKLWCQARRVVATDFYGTPLW